MSVEFGEHMVVEARASQSPATDDAQRRGASVRLALYGAAALSLVSAVIHLWVTPEHLFQWWGYGTFFLVAAIAQGSYAVLLLLPRRSGRPLLGRPIFGQPLYLAGIAGNLLIVIMYVYTRTAGVPLGPHAGQVEEVAVIDLAATMSELGLIVVLITLLAGAYRRWTINALLALGAALWISRVLGILP